LLSIPSKITFSGVLTPVSIFGIDLLTLLEQASVSIQILRSKRLTDSDNPPLPEEPAIPEEDFSSSVTPESGFSFLGGLQF